MTPRIYDKTGLRFGRLSVQSRSVVDGKSVYEVVCDCGKAFTIKGELLNRKNGEQSCGCRRATHGETIGGGTPEYRSWQSMLARCYQPSTAGFANYGGRGIVVCDRWRHSFEAFLADMGRRPTRGHTLDCIDPNGHYEPWNCRWATKLEQDRNRRTNHNLTIGGETFTMTEWSERSGVALHAIISRIRRGWPTERLLEPVSPRRGGRRRRCRCGRELPSAPGRPELNTTCSACAVGGAS